jgi:rRNA-processing protein FCF1
MTFPDARRHNGLLLDTNLFLVYAVGLFSPKLISEFKRTLTYSAADFRMLTDYMARFRRVITTPHVVTEVTDLLDTLNRSRNFRLFATLRQVLLKFEEIHQPSAQIAARQPMRFDKFGLADSALVELASQNYLVMTDDLPLFGYLESLGLPVINFNHLRSNELLK